MKKHRKHEEPIIDTTTEPGSVGELIELLQQFPESGKLTLNGNIDINISEDGDGATIYPKGTLINLNPEYNYDDNCDNYNKCNGLDVDPALEREAFKNVVMDIHRSGLDPVIICEIREKSSGELLADSLLNPCGEEIDFEDKLAGQYQNTLLAEMRAHNAYIAECLGELHRREMAALLEYNTQCLAHFGVSTNMDMCRIIDKNK